MAAGSTLVTEPGGREQTPACSAAPACACPPPLCSPSLGRSDSKQPVEALPGAQLSQLKNIVIAAASVLSKIELSPWGGADSTNSQVRSPTVRL